MLDQESTETKLARMEEHLKSIDETLKKQVPLRHVNKDGMCDAYMTVEQHGLRLAEWAPDIKKINIHDTRINQWTGALAAVALICSMIGALIATIIGKVFK